MQWRNRCWTRSPSPDKMQARVRKGVRRKSPCQTKHANQFCDEPWREQQQGFACLLLQFRTVCSLRVLHPRVKAAFATLKQEQENAQRPKKFSFIINKFTAIQNSTIYNVWFFLKRLIICIKQIQKYNLSIRISLQVFYVFTFLKQAKNGCFLFYYL